MTFVTLRVILISILFINFFDVNVARYALQSFAADSSLLQILTTSLSDGNGVIASSFYLISVFKFQTLF